MKKSELQQIIKEEIQSILKEGNVFPMWEEEITTKETYTFGYDLDNVTAVEEYLIDRYKVSSNNPSVLGKQDDENPDCKLFYGYGDTTINAFEVINAALHQDKELMELISNCNGEGNFQEGDNEDDELNESIKHFQKLAGIITEEYGISTKEAKSNDYYKKGMMAEEDEIQKELNESVETMSAVAYTLLPALGALVGFPLGRLIGMALYNDKSAIQQVKDWWQSKKDNKAMNKIAARIKDDPEVVQFLENPRRRGWQKMLASKLTPEEQQYVRSIYKSRFNKL